MKNYLNNKEFLNLLFSHQEREIFGRIVALTFDEKPIEYIEGKVIDGSVNIDGTSAVRRTCNLTLVANDVNIHEFYWGTKNKFKLEIGLRNSIDKDYPDIIWFKQGIFVITQFNTSQDTGKWTIKLQGKDKMCLLNGDVSGNLPFNMDFAREEYKNVETGEISFTDIPIKTIIKKVLVECGKELNHNIFINDIDEAGQEMIEYKGDTPLYLIRDVESQEFKQLLVDNNYTIYYQLKENLSQEEYEIIPEEYGFLKTIYSKYNNEYVFDSEKATILERDSSSPYHNYIFSTSSGDWFKGKINDEFNIIYDDLLDDYEFIGGKSPTIIRFNLLSKFEEKRYTAVKIQRGDVPGYRLSELIYAGELKTNAGDSLTSVLDKIKNQFTNFEYFYDVDGHFIFQKRREYLSTRWNASDENNDILYLNSIDSKPAFNFTGNQLISSLQNNPKITELKNDYTVWGNNKDNYPVHIRYAIDTKPTEYTPIRPLKERYITINKDANGYRIGEPIITEKFYNAPEVEPYNSLGLTFNSTSYEILEILDNRDFKIHGMDGTTYRRLKEALDVAGLDANLIFKKRGVYYFFDQENIGKYNEKTEQYEHMSIQDLFKIITNAYDNFTQKTQFTIIPLPDGGESWIIMYPMFAAYPYKTEDVYGKDADGEECLIHSKVDWRELIYQMALDFRKLNYNDDYWYYLKEANPWCENYQTGYEQYYIDLEAFWRGLYNPNPELIFDDEVPYKKIKNLTMLLDDDTSNDALDMIYIKNPYIQITDKENFIEDNLSMIYKYSTPLGKESAEQYVSSIYPFTASDGCCLSLDTMYYIEKQDNIGSMKGACADTIDDAYYLELNAAPINRIYVEDTNADTGYTNFIQYKLAHLKETYAADSSNEIYYMKTPSHIKLSEIKNDTALWQLYYFSDLFPISQHVLECTNMISKITADKDAKKYDTNFIMYIEDINFALKQFLTWTNKKDFAELQNVLYNTIKSAVDNYRNSIINYLNTNSYRSLDNSCLPALMEAYVIDLNRFNIPSNNTDLLRGVNELTHINESISRLVAGIRANQSQVSALTNQKDTLNAATLTNMKTLLQDIEQTLSWTPDVYDDSQLNYTKIQLSELNDELEEITDIEQARSRLSLLFEPIDQMETFLIDLRDNYILSSLVYFNDVIVLLEKIKNLYTIFNLQVDGNYSQTIREKVVHNGQLLLNINSSYFENDNDLYNRIQILKDETSNFQENIVRYNTDNFNYVSHSGLIYEPIEYYKARTGFNNNISDGNFWALNVFENPKALIFWFDFLSAESSELAKYSVPAIGTRTKVVNDKNIKIIHHKEIPNIIFYNTAVKDFAQFSGYTYIHLPATCAGIFETSSSGKTAKNKIDELLYNHSYGQESINIQAIPIYNLEPNSRICIKDTESQINGEYLLSKFTIPLNYKKLMSITATKIIDNIN